MGSNKVKTRVQYSENCEKVKSGVKYIGNWAPIRLSLLSNTLETEVQ